MKSFRFSFHTLSAGLVAAILAGCGALPFDSAQGRLAQEDMPPIGAAGAMPQASAPARGHFEVLHRFNGSDGAGPAGGVIDVNGTLYGTTSAGGKYGYGTVYSMSLTGSEKVLYSFKGGADGNGPDASLIDVKDMLYGVTAAGGGSGCLGYGCGTVYRVSTNGKEKVLHSFAGGSDGVTPDSALISVKGLLYGTTETGGSSKVGVVYSVSPTGSEKVVYSFAYGSDGGYPDAPLIDVNGLLYGTTAQGGSAQGGTVYSLTTTGSEKVLHNFGARGDGANPRAGLIDVDGMLYGTTTVGGGSTHRGIHRGIVYSITTTGMETLLHRFGPGTASGWTPDTRLISVKGTFYGATDQGGGGSLSGVVYSMSLTGSEKVLHSFTGGSDGAHPSGVIDVNGTLYGTAGGGGSGCSGAGCGLVFAVTP